MSPEQYDLSRGSRIHATAANGYVGSFSNERLVCIRWTIPSTSMLFASSVSFVRTGSFQTVWMMRVETWVTLSHLIEQKDSSKSPLKDQGGAVWRTASWKELSTVIDLEPDAESQSTRRTHYVTFTIGEVCSVCIGIAQCN